MNINKFWMIVNVAGTEAGFDSEKVLPGREPRFMHHEKERAELELLRLQKKHVNGEFVLLEAVAFTARSRVVEERDHYFVLPFPD